jgi:hypothetical protein
MGITNFSIKKRYNHANYLFLSFILKFISYVLRYHFNDVNCCTQFWIPIVFLHISKKKKTNIKNLEEVENEPIIKYHRQK